MIMKLEQFIEEVSSLGLSVSDVLNFLVNLYVAKELPYEVEVKPDYHSQIVFEVDNWVIELLHKYGILIGGLTESSLYGKHAIVRFHKFTEEGFKLGAEAFRRHMVEVYPLVSEIIGEYPVNLIKVLSLCSMNLKTGRPEWLDVKNKGFDLSTALSRARIDLEVSKLSQNQILERCKAFNDSCRILVKDFLVKLDIGLEASMPHYYDIYLSKFLMEYNGKVLEEANKLMEKLSSLGVAIKVPVYDTKGKYIWDAYRVPPEIACIFFAKSINASLSQVRNTFLAIELLIRAMYIGLTKSSLLEKIKNLGISESELKLAINLMYQRGLTSKYNEAGGPDSPAFIVIDKERALEEAEIAVSQLEDTILST